MIRIFVLMCILLSAIGTGSVFSFEGVGSGVFENKYKVSGCGAEKINETVTLLYLDARGRWTMETSSGTYTGTYNELSPGKKRSRFNLEFDQSSYAEFISELESRADLLCGLAPGSDTIANPVINKLEARLNKKHTTLKLDFKLSGVRVGGPVTGKVSYRSKGTIDINATDCARFNNRVSIKEGMSHMMAVTTRDINVDGAIDIVYTTYKVGLGINGNSKRLRTFESSSVVPYLQDLTEPATFLLQPEYTILPEARNARDIYAQLLSVAEGDLDGDGIGDVAVTIKNLDSVGVLVQDPGYPGQFLPVRTFPAATLPTDVAIADLDGDGINDMAVAGESLVLLMNDPSYPGSSFTEKATGVENASSVAIADIDGDGRNDLAVIAGDAVVILLQDPAPEERGKFSSGTPYAAGIGAADVAVGDLNGDSLPDLAVANRGGTTGSVSVLMQDPLVTGAFMASVDYPTGNNSEDVVIDDLNNDSLADLAVSNNDYDGGGISVLLQDPQIQGVFLAADDYPGLHGPNDIATADMNGDGLTDLVVADKCVRAEERPYIRFQDINNPGNFLYPVYLP